jgi:tRNA A-37 threonylcarbamoyl transferase component Bud32
MSTRLPSTPSSNDETWLDAESVDSEPAAPQSTAADDPLLGTTLIDAYAVDRVLGEGGMGRIYEAHHVRLPAKRFAIKALRPELLSSPNVRARFEREVEAVSRITHPGVVGIADVGSTPLGVPFMVCEHLSGLDLLAYIRRFGPLSNDRAIYMGCRMAEALEAAHAQGVIHRDIKPSNIFLLGAFEPLGPEWDRVKIIDFGLSRIAGRDDQLTATGIVMGTPAYMSPEQARGARTDPRTDVYGLGAVLYAAVTGGPPFREKTPQQTLLAVMGQEPVRPRERAPTISEGLELIIQRAMAREPDQRYPSMSALRLALAELELSIPAAHTPRLSSLAPRGVRARFVALAVSAAAFATAALATLFSSALRHDEGWTPLESAALLALAALGLIALARSVRRFRQRMWSNTALISDALPRLQAPLFAALLVYALTSLASRLAGDRLLALARAHATQWDAVASLAPLGTLPSAAALLAALLVIAHQLWVPLRPALRWVAAPALAAVLALAAVVPMYWDWLASESGSFTEAGDATPSDPGEPTTPTAPAPALSDTTLPGPAAIAEVTDAGAPPTAAEAAPVADAGPAPAAATPQPIGDPLASTDPPPMAPPRPLTPVAITTVASLSPHPDISLLVAEPPTVQAQPDSPAALEAEMLAHARRGGGMMDAVRTIERLLELSPAAADDPDVRRTLRQAASSGGDPAQLAFHIMSSGMGSRGPDLLYQIMLAQPALADKAKFLLSRHRVRKLFTPELAIAYDLRFSPSCAARVGLLPRASEIGDQRSINTLAALVSPSPGCGEPNHAPCLELCEREAAQFARAVNAIVRRIRSSERAASAN